MSAIEASLNILSINAICVISNQIPIKRDYLTKGERADSSILVHNVVPFVDICHIYRWDLLKSSKVPLYGLTPLIYLELVEMGL